jgi:hypothetical protein
MTNQNFLSIKLATSAPINLLACTTKKSGFLYLFYSYMRSYQQNRFHSVDKFIVPY